MTKLAVASETRGAQLLRVSDRQVQAFHAEGPIRLSLRKVNAKEGYYDLVLVVGDRQLEKKHVNLYEPLMFTLSDRPQPVELVVNPDQ